MAGTLCVVSAADYRTHWAGKASATTAPVRAWDGVERRVARVDRRQPAHDRRWTADRGRRYRLADRRQVR